MEIWGITGLMGVGKSTATAYLGRKGYPCLDVDQLTRVVVDRNTELGKQGFAEIYRLFGDSVLDRQGQLDRSALRKRILLNPSDKSRLEAVIDPLVLRHVEQRVNEWPAQGARLGFVEGSRLAEAGYHRVLKGIIWITSPLPKRVNRICKRDSLGKLEVEAMFQLQDREELMRRISHKQWKNDTTQKAFETQIDAFLEERLSAPRS